MTKSRETGGVLNTRGTAATANTGTAAGDIPTNADLPTFGSMATVDAQTSPADATAGRGVITDSLSDNGGIIVTKTDSGACSFNAGAPIAGDDNLALSPTGTPRIDIAKSGVGGFGVMNFMNSNGYVGSIIMNGSATSYNTSSDPRLKDFKDAPTDIDIESKFNELLDCSAFFTWKAGGDEELVWGFDAHKCIDSSLGMGSEGEGPRSMELGAKYGSDGNRVSPAGVDQSKAIPVLLAKIALMDRELKALKNIK